MFIKDPLTLLAECATSDLVSSTELSVEEASIINRYNSIEEASRIIRYDADVVPVVNIDGQYYTEMNWLSAYMNSNEIKSITEALDNVAESNKLPAHSVGLLIESSDGVAAIINKAITGAKKNKALGKVAKSETLAEKLKKNGYPIKRKKSSKKA
jgi:hypothetical protein